MTATNPDTYNGWTNYETWAVALWIDNDEPSYRHWRAVADEMRENGPQPIAGTSLTREPRHILADRLANALENEMPDLPASMWSDLLRHSFARVNWPEIADHLLEP